MRFKLGLFRSSKTSQDFGSTTCKPEVLRLWLQKSPKGVAASQSSRHTPCAVRRKIRLFLHFGCGTRSVPTTLQTPYETPPPAGQQEVVDPYEVNGPTLQDSR